MSMTKRQQNQENYKNSNHRGPICSFIKAVAVEMSHVLLP